MENMDATQITFILMLAIMVLKIISKLFKFDRGAEVADELQDALSDGMVLMKDGATVDQIAEKVASKIKGIDKNDMEPIIAGLSTLGAGDKLKKYGVNIEVSGDGKVKVNPTGLVVKSVSKIGKWFKKVF